MHFVLLPLSTLRSPGGEHKDVDGGEDAILMVIRTERDTCFHFLLSLLSVRGLLTLLLPLPPAFKLNASEENGTVYEVYIKDWN